MSRVAANVAGLLGLGGLGYGLGIWIHPGLGIAAVGAILLLLAIRSLVCSPG